MAKRGFLAKHRIVRNAIKEDLLFFAIPGIIILFVGLMVSVRDGYDGLVSKIWELIKQPGLFRLLSVGNIFGLVLFVFGMTIALIAVATLRVYYSSTLIIREDHQLATHGIYRYVRHPVYLVVIIAIMGAPMYASSLYGFLILFALIPLILLRIRFEEGLLTEEFGDAFLEYKATTKKLLPFIY
jgi:protein-S-isoprenylcysteine O-methyltransferase Ste14